MGKFVEYKKKPISRQTKTSNGNVTSRHMVLKNPEERQWAKINVDPSVVTLHFMLPILRDG